MITCAPGSSEAKAERLRRPVRRASAQPTPSCSGIRRAAPVSPGPVSPRQAGDKDRAYRSPPPAVRVEPSSPPPALLQLRGHGEASEVPNLSTTGSALLIMCVFRSAIAHFVRKWGLIENNTCNRGGHWKIMDFSLYYYFHNNRCCVYFSYSAAYTAPFGNLVNIFPLIVPY